MARVSSDFNLPVKHPALAGPWYPTKNGHLTSHSVIPFFSKCISWLSQKGHGSQDTVFNRAPSDKGRPHCSGQGVCEENRLETSALQLATRWHPNRKQGLSLKDEPAGSETRAWRICRKGHEREAPINMRHRGSWFPLYSIEKGVYKRRGKQ
jgi:hypothetical protein